MVEGPGRYGWKKVIEIQTFRNYNIDMNFFFKSWFVLQNWCDSIWYWVKLQYKKSYFMSYLLCCRCLEMFVKRFEYFFVSELPGMQGSIPVLTCSMWKKWFSKQNFETQFEFESHLVGPKSILKSLRKGNYLFFMISIWLDPKILLIWQKIQNLNDHFDSN